MGRREILGDLQVAYGAGIVRSTTNPGAVIAARSVTIPNGTYDYVRKKELRPVYDVSAIVRGGFSSARERRETYSYIWNDIKDGIPLLRAYSGYDLQLKA